VKSGAPEEKSFPAPHTAPFMISLMSHQEMERTHDNNIIAYR